MGPADQFRSERNGHRRSIALYGNSRIARSTLESIEALVSVPMSDHSVGCGTPGHWIETTVLSRRRSTQRAKRFETRKSLYDQWLEEQRRFDFRSLVF